MGARRFILILIAVFLVMLVVVSLSGLFDVWVFTGMLFLGLIYLFGYLFVVNYYISLRDSERENDANKKKLDWCWNRVNEILRKMPGGQGIEWRRGIGRRSEYRTYYDGIQHKPFRSLMGFLASTQQLVIIIYDIDGDDIVRFYADPDPEIIENHFYGFKPFQQKSSLGSDPRYRGRYPYRNNRYKSGRGVSIHVGNDDYDDFDSMPSSTRVDDKVADDAISKIRRDNGE